MLAAIIARLCDGDKKNTVTNRILGKLITVEAAQLISRLAGL